MKNTHLYGAPALYGDNLLVIYTCRANQISSVKSITVKDVFKIGNYIQYSGLRLNQSKTIIYQFSTRFWLQKFRKLSFKLI